MDAVRCGCTYTTAGNDETNEFLSTPLECIRNARTLRNNVARVRAHLFKSHEFYFLLRDEYSNEC